MNSLPLILASSSPRRIQLLTEAGFTFETVQPTCKELTPRPDLPFTPSELAMLNAYRKAASIAIKYPTRFVLGVDTIVTIGTRILGKPRHLKHARQMLQLLSAKRHYVLSGMTLFEPIGKKRSFRIGYEITQVTFKKLSTKTIDRYLEQVHVLDKAGAYAFQENGSWIVESIAGSKTNVIGLPMERLACWLKIRH